MKNKHRIILLVTILILIFNTIFLPSVKSFIYQSVHNELIERLINMHFQQTSRLFSCSIVIKGIAAYSQYQLVPVE